ncbi:MAG TPA: SRPBCC family protein [Anaerolineales bacterium]|jgi:carbon monoxide dehydrogenase subunit G
MAIIETSVTMNKPVGKVFEFLTNLENQKALNSMITEVNVSGKVAVGTKYKIKGTVMGRSFEADNEIVALEPNKKFGVKTLAAPPASDVTNTYILEPDGSGTKLTIQMDAVVMAMGMEDMVKNQLKAGLDGTLASIKKAVEA